jgi:hypothetical protein
VRRGGAQEQPLQPRHGHESCRQTGRGFPVGTAWRPARITGATVAAVMPSVTQYVDCIHTARSFAPLLALQPMKQRAMFSRDDPGVVDDVLPAWPGALRIASI